MYDPFWIFVLLMIGLVSVFITARFIFAAYFKSKREFLRDLWHDADSKGDD